MDEHHTQPREKNISGKLMSGDEKEARDWFKNIFLMFKKGKSIF